MNREDILAEIWKREEDHIYVSQEEFFSWFNDWRMVLHPVGNDPHFVAFVKGPEFHVFRLKKTRMLPLQALRDLLNTIIYDHAYACTRTPKDDERQCRFNEMFGFRRVGEDEFYLHYEIRTPV